MISGPMLGPEFWSAMEALGLPPNIVSLDLSIRLDEPVSITATWYPPEALVQGIAQPRTGRFALMALELEDAGPTIEVLGAAEAWAWLSERRDLELNWHCPVYCDDDDGDDPHEWRVYRSSGPINDVEFKLVGAGETALAAVQSARATLAAKAQANGR